MTGRRAQDTKEQLEEKIKNILSGHEALSIKGDGVKRAKQPDAPSKRARR